jgi:hypothetical protein
MPTGYIIKPPVGSDPAIQGLGYRTSYNGLGNLKGVDNTVVTPFNIIVQNNSAQNIIPYHSQPQNLATLMGRATNTAAEVGTMCDIIANTCRVGKSGNICLGSWLTLPSIYISYVPIRIRDTLFYEGINYIERNSLGYDGHPCTDMIVVGRNFMDGIYPNGSQSNVVFGTRYSVGAVDWDLWDDSGREWWRRGFVYSRDGSGAWDYAGRSPWDIEPMAQYIENVKSAYNECGVRNRLNLTRSCQGVYEDSSEYQEYVAWSNNDVFLPTEWSVYGRNIFSYPYENASTQGRLQYYQQGGTKLYTDGSGFAYWLASKAVDSPTRNKSKFECVFGNLFGSMCGGGDIRNSWPVYLMLAVNPCFVIG